MDRELKKVEQKLERKNEQKLGEQLKKLFKASQCPHKKKNSHQVAYFYCYLFVALGLIVWQQKLLRFRLNRKMALIIFISKLC